ncbi:hypothetical protein [Pyxidicoccus trucidator]|uniref:hypothetical protein n=1 Tax=Pyxidicoccus trucidator TaxID=2709662 RepID=UPI0013DD1BAB|nr:hypothetical protein [Pyxidicoccus trucidator]
MALRSGQSLTRLFLVATLTAGPALALAAAPSGAASSKRKAPALVQVKGTRVSLAIPEGFTETTRFTGFRQEATGATIRVKDYPLGGLEMTLRNLSEESLASQGMKLLSREEVKLDGQPGALLHIGHTSNGVDYRRWVLVLGNTSALLVIDAIWREQDSKALSSPLEDAMRSTRWNPDAKFSRGPDLFTLKETPGLKAVAKREQSIVMYTRDGKEPGKARTQPFLVIAPAPNRKAVGDDVSAFTLRELEGWGVKAAGIESSAPLTVGGLKGHEVVARAKDLATQKDYTLYFAVLVDEERYFLIEGHVGDADREEYVEHFKTAVRGFQRVPTH